MLIMHKGILSNNWLITIDNYLLSCWLLVDYKVLKIKNEKI